MNHLQRRTSWIASAALLLWIGVVVPEADAAEKVKIEAAIERGKAFLLNQELKGPQGSLACYALIKAGVSKDHPQVKRAINEIMDKCRSTGYVPTQHFNYEAGVDAMLLEGVDREAYFPQLELIAAFLISHQRNYGGWFYAAEFGGGDYGDTSISQYAVLGLWATSRAGVDVPTEVWQKAAKWLMQTQYRDGGFGYHPSDAMVQGGPSNSTGTMTVAGTGTLLVIRHVLFNEAAFDEGVRPAAAPRRYGLLERLPDEKEKKAQIKPKTGVSMSATVVDKALKDGVRWTGDRFGDPNALGGHENYYFYGVERMAALLDVEKIGNHNWYEEGTDYLLRRQAPDGSWSDACGIVPATALTLLFLTKATATTINKPKRTPQVGGGLLIGGRGLPNALDAVQVNAGEVTKRKQHGPVDGLLAELEKSSDAQVEAVQQAVVEAVQLDHPEELIAQVDRLKKLVDDKRLEVRRTAMWALGRSGDVSVAPYLIRGLSDPNESVAKEASLALCILSRRPNGCGQPPDPTDEIGENVTDAERAKLLDLWKKNCTKLWTDWYLKVRPYDERDDRTLLKRKSQ